MTFQAKDDPPMMKGTSDMNSTYQN